MAAIPALAQGTGASIAVDGPYARATPAGAQTGAVYMTIDNKTNAADHLTGASSDVAAKVQVHEMTMVNGIMQMREVAGGLNVPAGGSVTLKPGSYHVMLIGLKRPLTAGEYVPAYADLREGGEYFHHRAGTGNECHPGQGRRHERMGGMQDNKSGGMGKMEMK